MLGIILHLATPLLHTKFIFSSHNQNTHSNVRNYG